MVNRRAFLKTGAVALTAAATHRPLLAQFGNRFEPIPSIQDPRIKEFAQRALDAARAAGATYADVRLAHTRVRIINAGQDDFEWMTVGVRALVNGYWGFAASPIWTPDEMTRLAKQAVIQGTAGSQGRMRQIELAPLGKPAQGHWDTPVEIDPFTVPVGEIHDYKASIQNYAMKRISTKGYDFSAGGSPYIFTVQEKAFGSTDGSYCTQRLIRSGGSYDWKLSNPSLGIGETPVVMDRLQFSGTGWELYVGQPLRTYADMAIEEAIEDAMLPEKPVDVGRYDVIWDSSSVGQILGSSIGMATEADRAMGYEANATGTSYLNAPMEMLGTYPVGAPALTITGNRSEKGGVATVQWDDDGVTPDEFTLVKNGVLTDFSTTRESSVWFKDYYAKTGMPMRSHGCALGSQDILGRGMNIPVCWLPNLQLTPGSEALDFDACIAGVPKGLAFRRMEFNMDFQQLNGLGRGTTFEVRNGKRVARIGGAGVLLRAPDLWKSVSVLGGAQSVRRFGQFIIKAEPPQWCYYSVTAVPAVFKGVTVIDATRKA